MKSVIYRNNERLLRQEAKLRLLRALVLQMPRALRVPVPHMPRALRALVPKVPFTLRAACLTCLVPHVSRVLPDIVSHVSYVLLHITYFVPCVFSGCSYIELNVLLWFLSFTFFRCFKPHMFLYITTYFWHLKITNRDFKKVSWVGPFPTTKDIVEIII